MRRLDTGAVLTLGVCLLALSCAGGPKDMKSAAREVSPGGITFVTIPGGSFMMGDEVGDLWDGCRPVHKVTVSGFEMGATEVTNAQYAMYLNRALPKGEIEVKDGDVFGKSGQWPGERYLNIGYTYDAKNECWITYDGRSFTVAKGKENWPVIAVTWYGSKAFALHYGYDLPTEAEWEYAARGGKQFMYGTGDGTLSHRTANYDSVIGCPTPVGSYPVNPFGLYDMTGNVWEFCNDWYGAYPAGSVTNPTGPASGEVKTIRQGTWDNLAFKCRAAYRGRFKPNDGDYGLGFRVVRRR